MTVFFSNYARGVHCPDQLSKLLSGAPEEGWLRGGLRGLRTGHPYWSTLIRLAVYSE